MIGGIGVLCLTGSTGDMVKTEFSKKYRFLT